MKKGEVYHITTHHFSLEYDIIIKSIRKDVINVWTRTRENFWIKTRESFWTTTEIDKEVIKSKGPALLPLQAEEIKGEEKEKITAEFIKWRMGHGSNDSKGNI